MKTFRIIGLMSGTSLDGLDIADVQFERNAAGSWSFELQHSVTVEYCAQMRSDISDAVDLSGEKLSLLSIRLGDYYAERVNDYIKLWNIKIEDIDAIASHGQTIFHQPNKGLTLQIGNGPELSVKTGIKSIVDFRVKDVALGGSGAPLVPVADHLLFSQFADSFLNLGGFANISFPEPKWRSFDICPVNFVFNALMAKFGKAFDDDGKMGRTAPVDENLLEMLNNLDYYKKSGPKSLGWEWVQENVFPILYKVDALTALGTYYKHCAFQISEILNNRNLSSVFITGGGAFNSYLISLIKEYYDGEVILPSKEIINFKEAIAFAFIGALRLNDEINVYSSVTGARKDSCSGVIHLP